MVWGHYGEECQQMELDLCVFCEQMSLLLSIKKSWSVFCFRQLSNCLEVMSSHSKTTRLLSIMPNPLIHGLPRMRYRSCLGRPANSGSQSHRKSLENCEEEDGCLSTDYFEAPKGINQASLELHYTCRLAKVGGIHAKDEFGP